LSDHSEFPSHNFLYRCPATGYLVQGRAALTAGPPALVAQECLACRRIHVVDPLTGLTTTELSKRIPSRPRT